MYWQITEMTRREPEAAVADAPRFVLHRHEDASGAHHDLRLEDGNCLLGFRITGETLATGCWATEKMPHPKGWLEQDGDAQRVLAGTYQWRVSDKRCRELALHGADATVVIRFERCDAPTAEEVRTLAAFAKEQRLTMDRLPALLEDGLAARRNAIARFCGLSRELDGASFDESAWRELLGGLTLREIGAQLAAVEARYDRAHPPAPVSRPEPLRFDQPARGERARRAMRILGMQNGSD
ncbi:MAG TPA: hypothetical protein ENN29_03365 [Candidatus Hydrogenedentes bacterium]|nr:hypothetical protein [Candidatus Hydrogenedentota bacterium]